MNEYQVDVKNDIVVYTVIFGNYDTLKSPKIVTSGVDYICFTDRKIKSKIWKIVLIDSSGKDYSLLNRYYKIMAPYNELNGYRTSLYIDGSILIKINLNEFFTKYNRIPLGNFKHPSRNCLFEEIDKCILEKRGDKFKLEKERDLYVSLQMPLKYGLSDNKIILRKNDDIIVENIMKMWWNIVGQNSGRDQINLPFVLFKNNKRYNFFEENILNNDFFEVWPHKAEYLPRTWRNLKKHLKKNRCSNWFISKIEKYIKPHFINNS